MELEIDVSNLPLPKEINFNTAVGMLLKSNSSITVLKKEIFTKLRNRVKNEIFPLIETDFKLERKVSVNKGNVNQEDLSTIDQFIEDVEKMNLTLFGTQVIAEAFKKEIVRNECREPAQKVKHVIMEWFENYLVVLDGGIDKAVEAAMKIKHLAKCNIQKRCL